MSSKRSVIIYSGGMDSFTLLHWGLNNHRDLLPISFDYGQRHSKELACAKRVCHSLGLPHQIVDISAIAPLLSGSALTDDIQVPEGHYESDSMKATVVPNRNMILLSLAIGFAVSNDASEVLYGAHGGDHAIYPDCRPEFVEAMDHVSMLADYVPVHVEAPFLKLDKGDILSLGLEWGLDYGQTWTCYNGREKACGRCGSCTERLEAFERFGLADPLEYE